MIVIAIIFFFCNKNIKQEDDENCHCFFLLLKQNIEKKVIGSMVFCSKTTIEEKKLKRREGAFLSFPAFANGMKLSPIYIYGLHVLILPSLLALHLWSPGSCSPLSSCLASMVSMFLLSTFFLPCISCLRSFELLKLKRSFEFSQWSEWEMG